MTELELRALAEAGALLEHFDPTTTLQAISELAVPQLADWCFIHLTVPGGVTTAAIAHADPSALADARRRSAGVLTIPPHTAIGQSLASGRSVLMQIDEAELRSAARDDAHFETMKAAAYRSTVVAPLAGRDGVIGTVTFVMAGSDRRYDARDLDMLGELARRTAIAIENARLFAAEQKARAEAECARVRERRLHVLAARLSSALTQEQIAMIACEESLSFLGAFTCAVTMRDGDHIVVLGSRGRTDADVMARFARVPVDAPTLNAEAVRTGQLVWCRNQDEIAARFSAMEHAWRPRGIRSVGAVPFTFEGRTTGALALSFIEDRELSADDRDFLHAVGQLTAQSLERARLYEAHRASEDQLRLALDAGRAATWTLDLAVGRTQRDPSYRRLVGVEAAESSADFMSIHPDDRDIARTAYQRTLSEGVPYEPEVRIRRDDGTYMWIRSHARLVLDAQGKPRALAGVIVDIDDAKQASLRAEAERRINETLHRLARSFASELDEDRLVQLITEEVSKLIGAELAVFRVGARDAATSGDRRLLPALHASRLATMLAVPVATRSGEPFGTLLLGHSTPDAFSDQHARLVTSIASQTAVALDNARLYKTVRAHKEQLEIAVDRAQAADRRKDEFLAMLGHELRNPLAPIATALELMELKDGADAHKERDVIRRQVGHLTRLIEDLLDVSRITRGKIQLTSEVVEVSAVLAKAIEITSPLLEKRMQRLTIDVPRSDLCVHADPARLAQVFQNLLTNAAKYSDPQTPIELRARREQQAVVIEVRDHGVGITPELMPRLFELFAQGERALDRSEGGLGIGLSVAKSVCELHGGTIDVASAGTGQGATFTVTLPWVERARTATGSAHDRPTAAMRPLGNPFRVLVVDDNIDAATMLRDFLLAIGHQPAVAHDGPAALALASSFKPDIAVLDIGLPVMNGYELAHRLRETLGSDKLRLIAVTGYGQDADRARSREVGFEHHLTKPIELEALLSLLGKSSA